MYLHFVLGCMLCISYEILSGKETYVRYELLLFPFAVWSELEFSSQLPE